MVFSRSVPFYQSSPVIPMYPRCTSLRRFCGFSLFCSLVESITYVESIPRGVRLPPGHHCLPNVYLVIWTLISSRHLYVSLFFEFESQRVPAAQEQTERSVSP